MLPVVGRRLLSAVPALPVGETQASLIPKASFVGLDGRTAHLCVGGEAPMLRAGAGALAEFCGLKRGARPPAAIPAGGGCRS